VHDTIAEHSAAPETILDTISGDDVAIVIDIEQWLGPKSGARSIDPPE